MPKPSKGFAPKTQPIKTHESAALSPEEKQGEVLNQLSKKKLDQVKTFLEAGKLAISASDSVVPKTARTMAVKDVVDTTSASVIVEPEPAVDTATEPEQPAPVEPAKDNAVSLSKADLQTLLDAAVAKAKEGWDTAKGESDKAFQAQIDSLKAEVEKGADLEKLISSLEGFQGQSLPTPDMQKAPEKVALTVGGEGSSESRLYRKMLDNANTAVVRCPRFGQAKQRDLRSADSFFVKNKAKIRDGIEAELRGLGMFQGSGRITTANDAITVASDIPSIAYEYLAAMLRTTHYEDLIHWQFAKTDIGLGTRPGLTMGIARYEYLARPAAFSDRVLTPGTDITSSSTALDEKIVPLTIQELALKTPIGISTFIDAYSMMNLESIAEENLGRDYQYTKDLGLRSEWFRTDRAVYNDGGVVTVTPGDVGNGDGGDMSDPFMVNLYSYLKRNQVPAWSEDGCYGLSLNPTAAAQFMVSKGAKERDYALESGMDLVSRMVARSTGYEGGEVSGYLGKYNNFHLFMQNVYGIEGGTEGVNTVTLGAGSRDMLTSFAFGRDTIAWGTALPLEIRADDVTDFQRRQRLIWYSHETPESLDVKTTAGTGEQLRVVEVRTVPAAV
jgi:hypothetical protein